MGIFNYYFVLCTLELFLNAIYIHTNTPNTTILT